jgi:hypothetical protein
MADAIDVVSAALDPYADLATVLPRVRVSSSNFTVNTSSPASLVWLTTEFNIGTTTNIGQDPSAISLPVGLWLVTLEIQLDPAGSTDFWAFSMSGGSPSIFSDSMLRTSPSQPNMDSQGGSGHMTTLFTSPDPNASYRVFVDFNPNTATPYTVRYTALSAIRISDYFA